MTRKDYELIAETIATSWWHNSDYRAHFASTLADKLESDNPRFDRERFLIACSVLEKCEKCARRAVFFTSGEAYCSLPHAPAWLQRVKANA